MATTLIKNGRIVTAVDDYSADILITDGLIQTIGKSIAVGADVDVHDAAGLLVLPGGIDVHGANRRHHAVLGVPGVSAFALRASVDKFGVFL